jgi:HD-GYP domain-containing protein (c-di-GMP phosphodiesterase class II)
MHLPRRTRETLHIRLSAHEVSSLGERVQALHDEICRFEPAVDRMACALYDAELDLLTTFVNSTHKGTPLTAYQYKLSNSASLTHLAQTRQDRVVDDIPAQFDSDTEHNRWLLAQGLRSSYTVPMHVNDELQGFMFYDSAQPGLFTPDITAKLGVYGRLVALMIRHETTAVRSLVGSVRIAREFAHLRDVETGVHLDRMSRYCRTMARALGHSHGLSDEFAEQLFLFSPLHDIGKIGVPDAILRKQGPFTPDERTEMKLHVEKGCDIVERLVADFALDGLAGVRVLRNLVSCHHEYLDGSGYPRGLRGDEIPIEARIVTVSDIFDALSSQRVYKERWSLDDTFARLDRMVADGKLDAACVAALAGKRDEVVEIMQRFTEA